MPFVVDCDQSTRSLLLLEVELMETGYTPPPGATLIAPKSLLLLEVELMETLVAPQDTIKSDMLYRFYYWKWN